MATKKHTPSAYLKSVNDALERAIAAVTDAAEILSVNAFADDALRQQNETLLEMLGQEHAGRATAKWHVREKCTVCTLIQEAGEVKP